MLQLVFPTRSRTGSQFAVKLTQSISTSLNAGRWAEVNGYRNNTREHESDKGKFRRAFLDGKGIKNLEENLVRIMKYEDPGKDNFILEITEKYPDCLFVASHRTIEKVINSHHNIKRWGHPIEDVLFQFSSCLNLYQKLHDAGKLFLIDVDNPGMFSLDAFSKFLKGTPTEKTQEIVQNWKPINTLRYQNEKSGGQHDPNAEEPHPLVRSLREDHFWIKEANRRYADIVRQSNCLE